ncbi:hypothetical protein D3C85_1133130 [compost metagenome]
MRSDPARRVMLKPLVEHVDKLVVRPLNLFYTEFVCTEVRLHVLERNAPDGENELQVASIKNFVLYQERPQEVRDDGRIVSQSRILVNAVEYKCNWLYV